MMTGLHRHHHPKCRKRKAVPRQRPNRTGVVRWAFVGLLFAETASAQFVPYFRWGQACTVSGSTLFVHGGKVDATNSYSYSSAPNTNDLFALDLSTAFNTTNPTWTYISGSQVPSTSQGPAVAFHTFNAYTTDRALVFGGDGGPNLPVETNADSAWMLQFDVINAVTWTAEPTGWAQEPIRRMYHSAALSSKELWITGGQKADGSGLGYADTYVFNSSGSTGTFTQLTATNTSLPFDLVGHRSVVLPSGALIVLGGYSPSHAVLIPMSILYIMNTTSQNPVWTSVTLEGQTPSPRRNFALALLAGNKILIHGGGDATLQNMYSDGAILDMEMSPISWVSASGLADELGARVDHMALGISSGVLFGFGRGQNGPAPTGISLYDSNAGTFGTSYVPPSGPISQTVGGPAATTTVPGYTTGVLWPTSSASGLIPGQSYTNSLTTASVTATATSTQTGGGGTNDADRTGHDSKVAVIAVGTILGASALIALALIGLWWYYCRKNGGRTRRSPWLPGDRHRLIAGSGDTEDPELPGGQAREKIPLAGNRYADQPRSRNLLGMLPMPFHKPEPPTTSAAQRFDMLHDEDARSFGHFGGPSTNTTMSVPTRPAYRRLGSSTKQMFSEMLNASTTSFRAALGLGSDAPPTPGTATNDKAGPDWWDDVRGPFAENAPAMANIPGVTAVGMGLASRKRGGAQFSSMSSGTSSTAYRDPFSTDSIGHSRTSTAGSGPVYGDITGYDSYHPFMMPLDDPPPPSQLVSPVVTPPAIDITNLPRGPAIGVITPGTLASSETLPNTLATTLPTPTTDMSHSSISPFGTVSSLIGGAPTTPMKRTDSWWARFGRSSLSGLSRQGSGGDRINPLGRLSLRNSMSRSPTDGYAALDFRDPNPAPRLAGIEESGKSADPSPDSPEAKKQSADASESSAKPRGLHSKSLSSMKTADSEALEKMGRRMDVIQRGRTGSSDVSVTPAGSINEDWEMGQPRLMAIHPSTTSSSLYERPPLPQASPSLGNGAAQTTSPMTESPSVMTPVSGTQETYETARTHQSKPSKSTASDSFESAKSSIPPPPLPPQRRKASRGIAGRITAFEQMAMTTPPPSLPLSPLGPDEGAAGGRKKSIGGTTYGLTERPSLFVANPDRRSQSGSTMDEPSPPPS